VHRQRVQKFDGVNSGGVVHVDGAARRKAGGTDASVCLTARTSDVAAMRAAGRPSAVEDVVDAAVEREVSDAGSVE